jgi:hypothetical protein
MTRATQLRALLRNDEALLEHYEQWAADLRPGDVLPYCLQDRVTQVIARQREHLRDYLALTSPAAPAPTETLAGSLVTNRAAQPA